MKKRDLYYFFGCFIILLFISSIKWKIRNKTVNTTDKMNVSSTAREEKNATTDLEQTKEKLQIVVSSGNPEIEVLICSDQYRSQYHKKLRFICTSDYMVSYGNIQEQHKASEPVWFTLEDPWLTYGAVTLTPLDKSGAFSLPDLQRNQKNPAYSGKLVVEKKDEGLQLVNVISLEEYLYSVVPSEMPSDYPIEALKAQAICARTYALSQFQKKQLMDDSVEFQVYNNVKGNEKTRQAVDETRGQVMMKNGVLIDALYYSTSCGMNLANNLSEDAVFCAAMAGQKKKAWEKKEPWFRWKNIYSLEELTRLSREGWQTDIGEVKEMNTVQREKNGQVTRLEVKGISGILQLEGEYNIRKFLKTENAQVSLQDGSIAPNLDMLPSAFFYLIPIYYEDELTGYQLSGGGYGHGIGMSQNGARAMAEAGKNYRRILKYYYGKQDR